MPTLGIRIARATLLATLFAAQVAVDASAQEVDLEALVAWPFPSGLTSAAEAPTIAWVRNVAGARNVWVARGPDWTGRPVSSFDADDGQDLTDLSLSRDGRVAVFVRGGAPNRAGEIPNPTSNPEGVDREIWVVDVAAASARRLGPGHSPVLGPEGDHVVYVAGGRIVEHRVADAGDDPAPLVDGRGSPGELAVSPDGGALAWTSRRGDHAFIGLLDRESGEVRYLDPSVDRDGSPVWSPDGRELAFLRVPNRRDRLPFIPVRESLPWSIRVVRVSDGAARTVFTAPRGQGSLFQGISASTQILWATGRRIVFPWEGNGYTNLYSVSADAEERPRPIATGSFEVQYATLTPDGRAVVFSSNQDDTDRQHLWWGAVDGSDTRLLTPGTGIEWQPTVAGDGSIAFLASAGTTPAHGEILATDGRQWLVPDQETRQPRGLVEPEQVIFTSTDGMQIHGQLFLPPGDPPPGGWPATLFFHGGSRRQMLLGFHHRGYYHNTYSFNQFMASRGYAVLSVNYRSGIGYGLAFREAPNYGADGASEVKDVLGAGLYMAARDDVDEERIGLWGGSYGGYLTAHGLAQASDLFKAGVDVHGVHDWNPVIRGFVPSYDPAARPELAERAFESSPMAFVDDWSSPVLLIHGDDDRNVPFSESVELAEILRTNGVHVEQVIFPDEVHGFLLHRNWMAAFRQAASFFDRFLRGPVS